MTALPPSAAHAFVADVASPELDDTDLHHLARVLRLRAGETVTVADGVGGWRVCEWDGTGLRPTGDVQHQVRPAPPIAVGFALPKGDRPEWVVQKLTEVGVDRIVPLTTAHTVVRWDGDKAARNVERLRRVAREAAMQSRRAWLPVVDDVRSVGEAMAADPADVALAHPGGAAPSLERPYVLVGPEGGWAPAEVAAAPALMGLGPTVLRAETAALCVGFTLHALRTGMVRSVATGDGTTPS